MTSLRVIVAGGGTGGHFFPGLAVAQRLVEREGASVHFVGSADGIEARGAPAHGFPFTPIRVGAFRGGGLAGGLRFLGQLPPALATSVAVARRFRPNLVLGLGGYGSVPMVLAAAGMGIPSVLMEQNAYPGQANRMLARLARRVCTTFADSARFFPAGKSIHTGNPVRRLSTSESPDPSRFTVFVFGGSQGARRLNHAFVEALPRLQRELPQLRIVHQTGRAELDAVANAHRQAGSDAEVLAFIDDMGRAYGRADLVVCRAGASTLAELAAVGKPAILVPYPFAADDHQRANAEVVVRQGAAQMILDAELDATSLAEAVLELAADRPRLQAMAQASAALAVPDAVGRVVAVCRALVPEAA